MNIFIRDPPGSEFVYYYVRNELTSWRVVTPLLRANSNTASPMSVYIKHILTTPSSLRQYTLLVYT